MQRRIGIACGWKARLAAAMTLGLFLAACGGSSEPGAAGTLATSDDGSSPVLVSDGGANTAPDPTPSAEPPSATPPAVVAPSPAPDSGGTPAPASTLTWTEPAGFRDVLAAAIAQQPAYMGGYGGMVANPFPQLEGTDWFQGMQITRADAVILGNHFGRPSFRFYVDPASRHSNGLRAEFIGSNHEYVDGDTYNYRFSTYFPLDYRNTAWTEWNMFAQFHGPGFPAWGLHTAGGYLHMGPPAASSGQFRAPQPALGQWHDFDWTIHWSPDSSGWATLKIDGVLVFDYSGATMHPGESYYYPKFGSYLANNAYTQVTYSTPWKITRL